jgi:type I restriction enzyme M protein
VQAVFHNVSTTITQPKQLTELAVWTHWTGTNGSHGKSRDDFGDMYEGLLQKNANETKSGAGSTYPASADQNHYPSAEAAAA